MTNLLRVLIVGGGGLENALAWKLDQSQSVEHIYVAPGNAGTASISKKVSQLDDSGVSCYDDLVALAKEFHIGLVIAGETWAVWDGLREYFDAAKILYFGPNKQAARIEVSTVFAKNFMQKFGIPTAEYRIFDDFTAAQKYIRSITHRIVIKVEGMRTEKGVILPESQDQAIQALYEIFVKRKFAMYHKSVIIEELLDGEEVSISTFSDGEHTISLPVCQSHKQARNEEQGANTGGMGLYAPVPAVTTELIKRIETEIIRLTIDGLRQLGCPFTGLLSTKVMLTSRGPKVINYNAKFGDSEMQSILPLIHPDVDLVQVMLACVQQSLHTKQIKLLGGFACGVAIASKAYPGYRTSETVSFKPLPEGCILFHENTRLLDYNITVDGERVFTVVGLGKSLAEAVDLAYRGVASVQFEGMFYRKDVGLKVADVLSELCEISRLTI